MEENEIFEAETVEKEKVELEQNSEEEVVQEGFNPNELLNNLLAAQNSTLKSYVMKLSTLNIATKAAGIFLLFPVVNFAGFVLLAYNLYSCIYLLLNYSKIRDVEGNIKDMLSKGDKRIDVKKVVKTSLLINLLFIPLACISFYYYVIFK